MVSLLPLDIVHRSSHALLLLLAAYASFELFLASSQSGHFPPPLSRVPPANQPAPLTVTTLAYNVPFDTANVAHNCRIISSTRHRFLIYTDDMAAPYCRLCTCRRFVPVHCPNPKPGTRNHCEKAAFTARMVPYLREMVYLDSDLIVMRRDFLDRLYWRSRAHDFLASYDQTGYGKEVKYFNFFNSGLFFMRDLPGVNWTDIIPRMYRYRVSSDQSILTGFVFDYYKHWDTLSWRWHCRNVIKMKQDTPVSECYTIHDRNEQARLRARVNHTLLTITS